MTKLPNQAVIKDFLSKPFVEVATPPSGPPPYSELNFLTWPDNLIDLYSSENNLLLAHLKLPPWDVPSQSFHDSYLPEKPTMQDLLSLEAVICDFGVATWSHNNWTNTMTPIFLRAPEVLIGAPWDSKIDIWSLGISIVELLTVWRVFMPNIRGRADKGRYDKIQHIYEINSMFGAFPRNLLDKGDRWNVRGMFDDEGYTWGAPDPHTGYADRLWDCIRSLFNDERDGPHDFEHFERSIKNMMKIDPEERMSAKQLLEEPWLRDVQL